MKRIFALLLTLVLLLTSAAMAEVKLPIVEEPTTMTMMIKLDASRGLEPEKNHVFAYMEEITGIDLEYITVDNSAWAEKMSLTWASGDLPDIIWAGITADELLRYTGKLIVDLTPYLEEYAPNFYALYQANEDIRAAVTLPGGKIGSFCWTNMEIEKGAGKCPPEMLYINVDWMNKLGLEMPQTVEEYLDVCRAFRDGDPNGNGEADEIAVAPRNGFKDLKFLQPLAGFMTDNNNLFLDGDTIVYAPLTEEYKEWVKLCNTLYTEGLVDKDLLVQTTADIKAKGSTETQVYGGIIASAAFAVVGAANAEAFDPTPVFTASNGKQMWYNRVYANAGTGVITSSCKNIEAAVQFLDMFYADEYSKLVWMGVEGVAYQYNEDGSWDWIYSDEYPDTTAVRAGLTVQAGLGNGASMCPPDWFKLNDATEGPVNDERAMYAETYGDVLRVAMPALYLESDAAKERSTLVTDLNAYIDETVSLFINGEKDIEAGWEEFTATLKAMQAERVAEISQAAYDAAKA